MIAGEGGIVIQRMTAHPAERHVHVGDGVPFARDDRVPEATRRARASIVERGGSRRPPVPPPADGLGLPGRRPHLSIDARNGSRELDRGGQLAQSLFTARLHIARLKDDHAGREQGERRQILPECPRVSRGWRDGPDRRLVVQKRIVRYGGTVPAS